MSAFGENCLIDKCADDDGVIISKGGKHVVLPLMTFIMFSRKCSEISAFSKDDCEQIFTEYEYHVGHGYYIRVSNTASCVDIRRFYRSSSGVIRPTHGAVSLTFSRDVCDQLFTKYEYHIAHGFYIRVNNTASCVDIRRFCRSSSGVIQPTHDAVSLTFTEFEALRVIVPNLNLPNIEHCSDLHADQLSFLSCS